MASAVSGSLVGKYQLLRRIATGGMAELFLARATAIHGFEKLVVLKRILPQHAESDDFIRMFLAEARLAATLHHPNIVQVYDIGEESNNVFFTMEYVQGQDMRKLVRAARKAEKALPLEHILHIGMGIAAGLHHAHEKIGTDGRPLDIVHRDVSPSNVLVTYEGGVKIVDFGIAKATSIQTATIAGTLKGKIPYMSPEQCRGERVDRRSDIFSIGTLLWELTTGVRLFTGENEFAVIQRVAAGEVPLPTSVRPDYPPELEAIVMRALTADREQRYKTALDLQIDLEDFAREARLPVSSARMGKFMRELFEEEINQNAALMLQIDKLEDQPTTPQPALSRDEVLGLAPAPGSAEPESAELTPSELRAGDAGTPMSQASFAAGSATDIHVEDVPAPPASKLAVGLAMAVGALVVLFISATMFLFFYEPEAKPRQDVTPAVIVETPAPPEPKVEPPPEPPPTVFEDDEKVVGVAGESESGSSSGGDTGEANPAVDTAAEAAGEGDPVEDDGESSEPPKDDTTEPSTGDSGRTSTKRSTGKRTKSSSGGKSKWDPNSPFPI
ncbi:serine/threonine protein kinase [Paraliomyxa miuraensis]|uniref:serine/threonine protein kinase n=1 Tax=Paraliomyxa miuraensis TaxID=376150 RepID=UPI00225752A5|nr:serine/threonine-protein kinase [Paraliomyxa miuraensis]MCX4244816.1 serine/threonine protein kinase [Paraliomyxa miuraensis]